MRRWPRRYLLPLHRWCGLGAGLLFMLVALTGAAMAYRLQLEPVVDPALLTAPACAAPLPLDTLIAGARAASPGAGALSFIRLYADPGATVRIRFSDGQWVYVDPCSGRAAGRQVLYGGLFGTLGWLHIFGFTGNSDVVAGGVATLFALAMLGIGIVLWWPATIGMLRAALRLTPRLGARAFSLNLHKTVALYAAPVLLASAVTGMAQAFHWGQMPDAPVLRTNKGAPAAQAPVQQLWRQAQALVPQPLKTQVRFPASPGAPVTFEMVARSAPHANALSYVYLDPHSGQLLGYVPHAANGALHKAYLFAAALHYGWIGGVFGQLLLMLGALAVPVLAWTGTASYLRGRRPAAHPGAMRVTVVRKAMEARDVCSFELAAADGKALPAFSAGAHVDVRLPNGLVRQYSLCNDPRETHRYLIGVLRTPDSRGGSQAMHELVNEGDSIEISAPKNHFPLAHAASHSLLFAGGIGITPILCMAERLANSGAPFTLHYCVRSPERAAFKRRIEQSGYAGNVAFHFSEGAQQQRADLPALLARPAPGAHLYVCGPSAFMDAVIATALALGWPDAQIHREYFAGPAPASAGNTAFDVKIASSGKIVHIAADRSVVEALAAAGIEIPTSCRQGVCGTCTTRVLDGEPDHRDLVLSPAEKSRNDRFTPCCSRARGACLTLDL